VRADLRREIVCKRERDFWLCFSLSLSCLASRPPFKRRRKFWLRERLLLLVVAGEGDSMST